jgi:hypothetical protein
LISLDFVQLLAPGIQFFQISKMENLTKEPNSFFQQKLQKKSAKIFRLHFKE